MSETENKGFDLQELGAIEAKETEEQMAGDDPLQTILDSLLVSLQQRDMAISALSSRVSTLEKFVSYLLSRDEKFAATMQKAQPNEKAE